MSKNTYVLLLVLATDILSNYNLFRKRIRINLSDASKLYRFCMGNLLSGGEYNYVDTRHYSNAQLHLLNTFKSLDVGVVYATELTDLVKKTEQVDTILRGVTNIADLEMYLSMELTSQEILDILLEEGKSHKSSKPCRTLLDLAQLSLREVE